jgi:hypothetical protein
MTAEQFLAIPPDQRTRLVVVADEDMRDYVRNEAAVGKQPSVVWARTFSVDEERDFAEWDAEWQQSNLTDGVERAARRAVDGSADMRGYAKHGTLVAASQAARLVPKRLGIQARTVYQVHPEQPDRYLPVGTYYRETVEERWNEAIRLLMALGAIRIEASFDQAALSQIGFEAQAAAGAVQAGASAGHTRISTTESSVRIEMSDANRSVRVPEGLRWFDEEPSWQTLAEARLENGATRYDCFVKVQESHGLTSDVIADLKRAELRLGGSLEHIKSTVIRYQAEFFPWPAE